jgi:uncharacterized protein YdiU (UPF0061 family)
MAGIGLQFDTTYLRLPDAFYTRQAPVPVRAPQLVVFNHALARELGLDLSGMEKAEVAAMLCGNQMPQGATPLAQAYAGHQFGNFTMLGDGRAIVLGEHVTPEGGRFDIQLKGSGPTPYSRRGDGRAGLSPMLREYIISEAMHALGIPTTRSLAVVATGEAVLREDIQPGAVLTRVAASHLRVGTFEYAAMRGDPALLAALLDHAIERHYPQLGDAANRALALLDAVIDRQASLIVEWMRVGFIHGVMNTDNMTISGETIDYGPCAFLDAYHPMTAFSSIDRGKRYAFANQPPIAQWNLARLAEALLPLIDADVEKAVALATQSIERFRDLFVARHLEMMRAKLGVGGAEDGDGALANDFLEILAEEEADYTNSFRELSGVMSTDRPGEIVSERMGQWRQRWRERLARGGGSNADFLAGMQKANPARIPRNAHVEVALAAAVTGDMQPFNELMAALAQPYAQVAGLEKYSDPGPPDAGYRTFCGT